MSHWKSNQLNKTDVTDLAHRELIKAAERHNNAVILHDKSLERAEQEYEARIKRIVSLLRERKSVECWQEHASVKFVVRVLPDERAEIETWVLARNTRTWHAGNFFTLPNLGKTARYIIGQGCNKLR